VKPDTFDKIDAELGFTASKSNSIDSVQIIQAQITRELEPPTSNYVSGSWMPNFHSHALSPRHTREPVNNTKTAAVVVSLHQP
jgi:hypothetical protein